MPRRRSIFATRLLAGPACAGLFAAVLAGCASNADYYVASNGRILRDVAPADVLVVSGAHDLSCDAANVRTYPLELGTRTSMAGRVPVTRANTVDVAEGCGKRAVYKLRCAFGAAPEPPATTEDEARRRRWRLDDEKPEGYVCEHVLLSRVDLDRRQ